MATANQEHQSQLRQIAELILAVSGESVTVMKRNAPERALKLKRQDEWGIYLEFLKVMFNLTDRLSATAAPMVSMISIWSALEPNAGSSAFFKCSATASSRLSMN